MKTILILTFSIVVLLTGCGGCSRSARRETRADDERRINRSTGESGATSEKNIVSIEKIDGVYQIPVEIDGVPMHFIFDTGAGLITISAAEAIFLYKQGQISDEDIIGSGQFMDANGTVSEGTIINLKTVKIGNRVLKDIRASVVHNLQAPLLFGQSALEKFGKVSIDYQKMEIAFE